MSELHSGFSCQDPWEMELVASLATDHTWCGTIVKTLTAGEDVDYGELCYYKSDSKMWGTDADVPSTTEGILAIALEDISADASGKWLLQGDIRDDSTTFSTIGGEILVSTTKFGFTQTKPYVDSGDTVRKIGHAWAAHIWFFNGVAPYEYPEHP